MSVTLSVLEKPGAKLTALIKNLSPLTRAQYLLLRNVTSHERRCQLLRDGHLEVEVGDQVMFSSPRAADTVPVLARSVATATVQLKCSFHLCNICRVRYIGRVQEMSREGHLLGLEVLEAGWCQGSSARGYFECEAGRAVFGDIGCVSPVRGHVGRVTSLLENNNHNNKVLNITLKPANNLRMIHNDLKSVNIHPRTQPQVCL